MDIAEIQDQTLVRARSNPQVFEWVTMRDGDDYPYPAEHFRHSRGTVLNKKCNLV